MNEPQTNMNNTQTINLQELSIPELDQLSVSLCVQLTHLELSKTDLLNKVQLVLQHVETRKNNEKKKDIVLPTLKKLDLPKLNRTTETN